MENNIKNLNALLKPFNLEEALKGAPVVTRDGRKVTHLHYFKDEEPNPFRLYAVIDNALYSYKDNGSFGVKQHEKDLFMEDGQNL